MESIAIQMQGGRVNGTFDCKIGLTRNAQLDSYGNIINEYYNIENGELTGYITRKQNADYDRGMGWSQN